MSHGVHVIEARAELVEDGDQFFERDGYTHRKKIGCILGFIMLLVIIIGVITTPVVISTKKREHKSKQLHLSGKSHKGPPGLGGQHTSTSNDDSWKDDGYGKPCLFGRCDDKLQDISNKLDEVLNQKNVSTTEESKMNLLMKLPKLLIKYRIVQQKKQKKTTRMKTDQKLLWILQMPLRNGMK